MNTNRPRKKIKLKIIKLALIEEMTKENGVR